MAPATLPADQSKRRPRAAFLLQTELL